LINDDVLGRWITDDDEALKKAVSLEGRALFLLLALDVPQICWEARMPCWLSAS
jgi:hypothetical protein